MRVNNALKIAGVALLALLTLGTVSSAYASSRFRADIPFDFTVNNATLPAGTYILTEISPGVLVIRNENRGQSTAIVLANSSQAAIWSGGATLIFRHSGDSYFLGQMQSLEGRQQVLAWQAPRALEEVAVSLLQD